MGQGYIAAGGPSGYLDVRQLSNNDIVCEQSIGRTVNNSLHICDTPIGLPVLSISKRMRFRIDVIRFQQ